MNTTKPRIPPPPKLQRLNNDIPAQIPDNLSKPSSDIKDLNFKVDPDFHRKFKLTASAWGMSMKELLEACYQAWVDEHGENPRM